MERIRMPHRKIKVIAKYNSVNGLSVNFSETE